MVEGWFRAVPVIALMTLGALAGCLGSGSEDKTVDEVEETTGHVPVAERYTLAFNTTDKWSHTLEAGPFAILDALEVDVPVNVPLGKGAVASVNIGVFLPDVPEGTKVPVVADVGPYYYDGDAGATDPNTGRLGGFLIQNLVPHGFAVAQVSVTGTGKSSGCMDLMGPVEQAGIHAAVEYLGTADWSNGNVGLIGRSYDGSTPWEAAMTGSPHLKTIVPISGLYGQHELMWRNGSAESRGPGLLWAIYYTMPFTPAEGFGEDPLLGSPLVPTAEGGAAHAQRVATHMVCPEAHAGIANMVAAYLTASRVAPQANPYFTDRSFKAEVLANYEGSVYFIHGLQDWNVDPHMAFPAYNELEAKGLEMKGLFGQWGHMYPDRPAEHENLAAYPASVRYDWAQDLLEWFTYYLKNEGPSPELHVEVQDDKGGWRIESTWPPSDVAWDIRNLGDAEVVDIRQTCPIGEPGAISPGCGLALGLGAVANETRFAGLARLHVSATPRGPGGQLYAELRDATDDVRLGHAIMDLRNHGGDPDGLPVAPNAPLVARMEFEPMDVVVPAGHELELVFANTGRDYLPSAVTGSVMLDLGGSVLKLPTVVRTPGDLFTPVPWKEGERGNAGPGTLSD